MKCDRKNMILYAITDRKWTGKETLLQQVKEAIEGGATCIQLREKHITDDEFLKEAEAMAMLCREYRVPLIINDNVGIAVKSKADGVHLGQDDMNPKEARELAERDLIIGVTVHSVREAVKAEKEGADYLGAGAVFSSSTKENTVPMSYETLRDICKAVSIPVVAIGGITKFNMMSLAGSGISGVALVSAVFGAENIKNECRVLRSAAEKIGEWR